MNGKTIGYVRVSTVDQNPDRQLADFPVDKIFVEYASGKSIERPQLSSMLDYVREGDTLVVHSMDRLARDVRHLRSIVDILIKKDVKVKFLKENLTFDGNQNAMSMLMLNLMGAFAEFEYSFIKERQREGILAAKQKKSYKGSKKKLDSEKIEILKKQVEIKKTKKEIAKSLGISRSSLYNYIKQMKND